MNTEEKKNTGKDKEVRGVLAEILSWVEVIIAAVVIAFVVNSFIIANSTVPTGSMETTIMSGDRVIGSRLSYTFGEPERGDIAIFKFGWICNRCGKARGENPAPDVCPYCNKEITRAKTLYYVKRVIGMPGDLVEIKAEGSVSPSEISVFQDGSMQAQDGKELVTAAVYVNGEKLEEDYLREPMLYTGDMSFEVPEDSYFLMGDNRNDSLDARYWNNHYISGDNMLAKVLFRYFPNPSLIK